MRRGFALGVDGVLEHFQEYTNMLTLVLSISVALTISFLCSLLEATLLSLTPAQVEDLAVRSPGLGATWRRFKAAIEHPIAVILILNTTAHTVGASVAGAKFDELYGDEWIWLFALVFTFAMLQFTEILPKTLGVRFNRDVAVWAAPPLQAVVALLRPLLSFLHWLNRPFELKRSEGRRIATVEEISALAGLAQLSREISSQQERIIKAATRLSRLKVGDVLIPVGEVSFLSTSQTIQEALSAAQMDAHTRYPVCEQNDRDRVVGYVNFKELVYFMGTDPREPGLQGVIRPLFSTSPERSAADLLSVFVEQHIHIALVTSEAGKTLGLVTLEDLIEELVGDLQDEFDDMPHMLHSLPGGVWMVGGGLPMAELSRELSLSLSDARGSVTAWLTSRLGRPPRAGDVYREGGAEFTVRRTRRGKVFETTVRSVPPSLPATRPENRVDDR